MGLNSGSSRSNNRSSGSSGSGHRTAHERSTNLHAAAEAEFHSRRRWAASQSPVFPTSFSLSPAETIAYLRVGASTGRRLIFRSSLFSSTTSTITTATQAVSTVDCFGRNNRLRRGGFDSFWRPARVIHHRDVTRLKLNPIQIQVWVGGTTTQYNNRPPTLPNRSDGGLLLKKKNSVDIFMGVEGGSSIFHVFCLLFYGVPRETERPVIGFGSVGGGHGVFVEAVVAVVDLSSVRKSVVNEEHLANLSLSLSLSLSVSLAIGIRPNPPWPLQLLSRLRFPIRTDPNWISSCQQ